MRGHHKRGHNASVRGHHVMTRKVYLYTHAYQNFEEGVKIRTEIRRMDRQMRRITKPTPTLLDFQVGEPVGRLQGALVVSPGRMCVTATLGWVVIGSLVTPQQMIRRAPHGPKNKSATHHALHCPQISPRNKSGRTSANCDSTGCGLSHL